MKRFQWLSLVAAAVCVTSAAADILPPGAKWVSHRVRFEQLANYPDFHFYLAPKADWRGRPEVKEKDPDDVELDLSLLAPNAEGSLGGNPMDGPMWLFAVPKKLQPDATTRPREGWFTDTHPEVLKVELMWGRRSAPVSEKRDSFLTVYRVDIQDGKMTATVVSDETPGGLGADGVQGDSGEGGLQRAVIGSTIAVVALALGLFLYFRKRG